MAKRNLWTPSPLTAAEVVERDARWEAADPGCTARRAALRALQDRLLAALGGRYDDDQRLSLSGPADMTVGALRAMLWPGYEDIFERLIAERD